MSMPKCSIAVLAEANAWTRERSDSVTGTRQDKSRQEQSMPSPATANGNARTMSTLGR